MGAAALLPLLVLLLGGAARVRALQEAPRKAVADQRACVEGVPGPVTKLKARARSEDTVSYSWYAPRGDPRRGDICVDYYERSLTQAGAPAAKHASSDPLAPSGDDGEFMESWQDLTPATNYRISVRAVNAKYGPGPAATAPARTRGSADDSHPPGPVLDFDVSEAGASLVVSWEAPRTGGWAASYEVIVVDPNQRRLFDDTVQETQVVITTGLRRSTRYEILVAPANHSGRGPMSRGSPPMAWALADRGGGGGGGGDTLHALHSLSRHVNGEAAKVAGVVGAQLLVLLANWQRAAAAQSESLHGRLPWRRGGGADRDGGAAGGAAAAGRGWRLPWARGGGGAGAPGERGAGGRGAPWDAAGAARDWLARGAAAERALDLREALSCYQSALSLQPSSLEYLCRVAKQWSDLTYEPGAGPAQAVEANSKAVEFAERAVALAPEWAGGYIAECVSKGRLALFSDNKTKVRLAKEAREAAVTALALEPGNDLAHHLMGRWHYEMAQINFVVRQLVRLVYGAALAPGTFPDALSEFQAAADLAPGRLIHRVELGRTLLKLGRRREALAALEASLAMDVEDVNAKCEKDEAEAMLARLRRELGRGGGGGRPALPVSPWGGGGGGGEQ
ncbi:MAG: hypothetical protein J3K34DRAFT_481196 [Monoraphidium minutum]|nr:MAG: hypothetical protein J3K34DRAFT_481196 [Monoraphidium minutum]